MPRLGQHPVSQQMFQLLITPGALELARIPPGPEDPERQRLDSAIHALSDPLPQEPQQGTGQPAPLVDRGPQPVAPLPEAQRTPVGRVIARLLAQPQEASRDVLRKLRQIAYPNGVLQREYPDIGEELQPTLQGELTTELRDIAVAAGISADQLDAMVSTRQGELAAQAQQAGERIAQAGQQAAGEVSAAGQQTLGAITGARQATDEEIVRRQEVASGGSDPQVIEARRDLVLRWARERVTTQTTNYQNAGERRDTELTQAQRAQEDAYTATAQRDEYQILNPRPPEPPRDPADAARERRLQDQAAGVRAWARERNEAVQTEFRRQKREASTATRTFRTDIETAGTAAIEAARQWAEDRMLEGRSWWDRLVARLQRWFGEARDSSERWEVRRTQQTRDGIVSDLRYIALLEAQVAQGATQEQLLSQQGLTQEQRAIIEAYFEPGGRRHPLDLAAAGLRQRLAGEPSRAGGCGFRARTPRETGRRF